MERADRRHGDNLYPVTFSARLGDYELDLDVPAGVWNPTPNGIHLGNMLCVLDLKDKDVLELGTGCGIHGIVIAKQGASRLTVTEIEQHILDNAKHNFEKHGVNCPVEYMVADWVSLPDANHDVLITNPPFAKSGKRYRRYFIDTLILNAHKLVKPGGRLVFVHSSMAGIPKSIQLMQDCGMRVKIVGEVDGPFRDYYFEDQTYMLEMAQVPGAYSIRQGTYYERLVVFEATLS